MKNILQSILPVSANDFKQKLVSISGAVILLCIFIFSTIGKNKVSSKNAAQCQHASANQFGLQIAPDFAGEVKPKANDVLFQSADGGESWQNLSAGLPENVQINQVLSLHNEMYAGTPDGYIYHSSDLKKGEWIKENIGGLFKRESVTGIFAGKAGPYVNVNNHGIFKRIPGTGFWQPLGKEVFKDIQVHDILETPEGILYVASGGGIFVSNDEGAHWKHVYNKGWVTGLVMDKGVVVAAAMEGLLRSVNGSKWTCILQDAGALYKLSALHNGFAAIRVAAPWQSSERAEAGASDQRLRISTDGAATWQQMNTKGLSAKIIYDFEQSGKYLFMSHNAGISRSADGGKTWQLIRSDNSNSEGMKRTDLMSDKGILYAIVGNAGC